MSNELGRIWKEAVVTKFEVLSRHLSGWRENLRIAGLQAEI
jgi:hypothetical protein